MKKHYLIIALLLITGISFGQSLKRENSLVKENRFEIQSNKTHDRAALNCDEGSLFANNLLEMTSGSICDDGYLSGTEFSTIGGTIQAVKFWGLTAYYSSNEWVSCDESSPLVIDIQFYENLTALEAGNASVSFTAIEASATMTSELFGNFPIYEWNVTLPSAVSLTEGIIVINADSLGTDNADDCWFLWGKSPGGYGNSYTYNNSDEAWDIDTEAQYSVCLSGTAPTCFPPSNVSATNIELSSATLSWLENGTATSWNIEYGEAGFTPTGIGISVDDTTTTISDLNPSTTYDFYVQSNCGNDDVSVWVGPFQFSTLCETISSYPYSEGFEGGELPVCWAVYDADGDGYNWDARMAPGYPCHEGDYSMGSDSYDVYTQQVLTPDNYLITPQFDINADNYDLMFWVSSQDISYVTEKYSVLVSTTGTSPEDFTDVIHTETLTDTAWHKVTLSLSDYYEQSIYIAFRHYESTNNFEVKIDMVSIDVSSDVTNSEKINDIRIFPNPTSGMINISNTDENKVIIYNMLGEIVSTAINASSINLADFDKGTYILKLITDNKIITRKIILNK